MENTFRKTLIARIESVRAELRQCEAALKAFDAEASAPIDPRLPQNRFEGVRPFDAIVEVLRENGGRMNQESLMDTLIASGATLGKKRGRHNLRISLELNTSLGKLIVDGEDVLLPTKEH